MRKATRRQERAADWLPVEARGKPGEVMAFKHGDVVSISKITTVVPDLEAGVVLMNLVPIEDTIHPHPVPFKPPYVDFATADGNGFQHFWEKLHFAFRLPSPYDFPAVPELDNDDRQLLADYVTMCKKLATYSALSHASSMNIQWDGEGITAIDAVVPDDEAMVGSMTRFRQLHSHKENASFTKAAGRLQKAVGGTPDLTAIVSQWQAARGALMNRTISTIICGQMNPSRLPLNDPNRAPASLENVNPDKLMLAYNYGNYIHLTDARDELAKYEKDEITAAYYRFALMRSFAALAHLYLGFAVLCEHALAAP